jgi:hypothetical protein
VKVVKSGDVGNLYLAAIKLVSGGRQLAACVGLILLANSAWGVWRPELAFPTLF